METWTWFQEQIALLKKAAKDNEVHRKGYTIKFKWRGGDGYGGAGRRTHDFGFFRPDGAPPLRSTSSVAAALGVDAAQLRGTKETESAPADKKGEKKRGPPPPLARKEPPQQPPSGPRRAATSRRTPRGRALPAPRRSRP